ncbi:hypothetical protein D039_3848A, partial [Vibrio parahaemolyticus EKP-028]
MASHKSAYS